MTYKELTPLWDRRKSVPGSGFHALVIGVSQYPYLNGGKCRPIAKLRPIADSLSSLNGPAKSAADLALWLYTHADKLSVPLKTCRTLLSPSPDELPGCGATRDACWKEIHAAIWEWHEDLRDPNSYGLLYFAGHGIQKDKLTPILLPSDFLGGKTILDRAIDALEIWRGMCPSEDFQDLALTQLYFFDACQTDLSEFRNIQTNTPPIFDVIESGVDKRAAPIFFSSRPGHAALGIPGKGTHFGMDLLRCLSGAAAEQQNTENGPQPWQVTIGTLGAAMNSLTQAAVSQAGAEIRTFSQSDSYKSDTVINILDGPPNIPCTFRFNSRELENLSHIALKRSRKVEMLCPVQNPHVLIMPAGIYGLEWAETSNSITPGYLTVKGPFIDKYIRKPSDE